MAQQVKKKFIGNDQVDGSKIKLLHGQTLRGTDALGNEIDILANIQTEIDQAQTDSQSYTDQKIADLVDSAPALLDTLNELAAAIGDDPNFVTTVVNQISGVQSNLDQEILDRIADVNAEETRALAAEGVIASNLAQEILDRQADVDAEEARALAAEAALDGAKVNKTGDTMSGFLVVEDNVTPQNFTQVEFGSITLSSTDVGSGDNFSGTFNGGSIVLEKENAGVIYHAEVNSDSMILTYDDGINGPVPAMPTLPEMLTTKAYVDQEISALSSGGIAAVQSELDATQVGAGLGTDGSYSAPVGSNYLGSAVSLKDADSKLDAQIKVVADGLAQEILDRAADVDAEQSRAEGVEASLQSQITQEISDRQADVDAEQLRAETAESVLQSNIDVVSDDVSHLVTLSGVSVDSDHLGTFTGSIIPDSQTVKQALQSLETALDQEISDRISDVNAEESRALAAESALDSRIDVLESVVWFKEKFSIVNGQTSVTLSHTPEASSMSAFVDRLAIHEGASEDYTISGTTMTFLNDLVSPGSQQLGNGDTVYVKYQYKV